MNISDANAVMQANVGLSAMTHKFEEKQTMLATAESAVLLESINTNINLLQGELEREREDRKREDKRNWRLAVASIVVAVLSLVVGAFAIFK